jgi:hypothetical protein
MKHPLWILLAAFVMSISSAANGTPGDILVTQEDRVEVYDAPSSAAQILITVEEGRKLKELRREGQWIRVLVFGEIGLDGWVHDSSVETKSARATNAAQPDVSANDSVDQEEASLGPRFVLDITGTPQQQIRVRCKSVGENRATIQRSFEARIPNTYEIEGTAVSCRVHRLGRHAGWLRAEIYDQGGSEALGAAQTSANKGCVSVRTRGRWGKAWGRNSCARDTPNW